jgi:ATP-dependent DNA helicase 2 subunit 2
VPFADDLRKYTFRSLKSLRNRKNEVLTNHPYLPTNDQTAAMSAFVDSMNLMKMGEKDEDG